MEVVPHCITTSGASRHTCTEEKFGEGGGEWRPGEKIVSPWWRAMRVHSVLAKANAQGGCDARDGSIIRMCREGGREGARALLGRASSLAARRPERTRPPTATKRMGCLCCPGIAQSLATVTMPCVWPALTARNRMMLGWLRLPSSVTSFTSALYSRLLGSMPPCSPCSCFTATCRREPQTQGPSHSAVRHWEGGAGVPYSRCLKATCPGERMHYDGTELTHAIPFRPAVASFRNMATTKTLP